MIDEIKDGLDVDTFANFSKHTVVDDVVSKDSIGELTETITEHSDVTREMFEEPIFDGETDPTDVKRPRKRKVRPFAIVVLVAAFALIVGVVFGIFKLLSNDGKDENVEEEHATVTLIDGDTVLNSDEVYTPVLKDGDVAEMALEESKPTNFDVETTDDSKAQQTDNTEKTGSEDESTSGSENQETEVSDPQYALGEGPMGTAGRVYFADGSSEAVNWSGTSVDGAIAAHTDVLTTIISGVNYIPVIGKTMAMVDEYGYSYVYQCVSIYNTYTSNGKIYLSDGVVLDEASYGNMAINSNGTVSFWNIVG